MCYIFLIKTIFVSCTKRWSRGLYEEITSKVKKRETKKYS